MYSRGCFCQTETAGSSGRGPGARARVTTYYLVARDGGFAVSTLSFGGWVSLSHVVTYEEHDWSDWYGIGEGQHRRVCLNCGAEQTENCEFDEDTNICPVCGAYDPALASVSVSVGTSTRSFGFMRWRWTYYTAEITVETVGVKASRVEYSLDGSSWYSGRACVSFSEITELHIRVTDTDGGVCCFTWADGEVTAD